MYTHNVIELHLFLPMASLKYEEKLPVDTII